MREKVRERRRDLLPPPRQARDRTPSPQRHQRDRHPQLVFPYAPGHEEGDLLTAQRARQVEADRHAHAAHALSSVIGKKVKTIKVRKFVDGYWKWVSLPPSHPHSQPTSSADTLRLNSDGAKTVSELDAKETSHEKETIWSKARSSITSVHAASKKILFWPAGPRRLM